MTNDAEKLLDFERRFAERLLDLAADAAERGIPPDLIARALLGAGLSYAQRFAPGHEVAAQLRPVLDAIEGAAGSDATLQ
jgi:hypothetical protein